MFVDHVIYGVRDLVEATHWFADSFGLASIGGGVHPQWGTANAIIPVGPQQYVELLTVEDPASEHPLARAVQHFISDGDCPIGLVLRPDDFDATTARLGLEAIEGARTNAHGGVVRWRMAGMPEAMGPKRLPAFIEWPARGANPDLNGVEATPQGWAWIEVGADTRELQEWVGGELELVRAVAGEPGTQRFAICRDDEIMVIGRR